MKKFVSICLILFAVFSQIQSQTINYKHSASEVQKSPLTKPENPPEPLGLYENFVLYHNLTKQYGGAYIPQEIFISKVNIENLNEIENKRIDLVYKDQKMDFVGIELIKDKIYVFSSFKDEMKKMHYAFARIFDVNTLEPIVDLKPVAEISYKEFSKNNQTRFRSTVSKDGRQIMIFFSLLSRKKHIIQNDLFVLSSDLEPIWGYNHHLIM